MNLLTRLLTKNLKSIPLFTVTLNYKDYIKNGEKDSCNINHHPVFRDDKVLVNKFRDIIDYIRENYEMEDII